MLLTIFREYQKNWRKRFDQLVFIYFPQYFSYLCPASSWRPPPCSNMSCLLFGQKHFPKNVVTEALWSFCSFTTPKSGRSLVGLNWKCSQQALWGTRHTKIWRRCWFFKDCLILRAMPLPTKLKHYLFYVFLFSVVILVTVEEKKKLKRRQK